MDAHKGVAIGVEGLRAVEDIYADRIAFQLVAIALDFPFDDIFQEGAQSLGARELGARQNAVQHLADGTVARPFVLVRQRVLPKKHTDARAPLSGATGDSVMSRQKRRLINLDLGLSVGFQHRRSPTGSEWLVLESALNRTFPGLSGTRIMKLEI